MDNQVDYDLFIKMILLEIECDFVVHLESQLILIQIIRLIQVFDWKLDLDAVY